MGLHYLTFMGGNLENKKKLTPVWIIDKYFDFVQGAQGIWCTYSKVMFPNCHMGLLCTWDYYVVYDFVSYIFCMCLRGPMKSLACALKEEHVNTSKIMSLFITHVPSISK